MSTAKVVPLTCHGHSRPVTHLSFSSIINDDQFFLISGCKDNNPMLRNGITGDWIGSFIGHKGAVWQTRLSDDAVLAATGSADFTAKVWDTSSGECLQTMTHGHIVRAIDFSPGTGPSQVATGGFEKKLRIYDLQRGSNDGNRSSSAGGIFRGENSSHIELGAGVHTGAIKSIVWGSGSGLLVTASDDKTIRWWDVRQRQLVFSHILDGPLGSCELSSLSTSQDNKRQLLTVGAGKTAYFFDGLNLVNKIVTGHEIASVAVNDMEKKFVTGGSADTWVRVYSFEGENVGTELNVHKGHHGPVWSTSFAPGGKLYATGSEDGTIKLWKFCDEPYGLWK